MIKKLVIFVVLVCGLVWVDRVCHKKVKELPVAVYPASPVLSQGDAGVLTPDERQVIDQILNQKFTYLDKGSQAYVFVSEDQQYVLKFLKQHLFHPNSWLCYLPFEFNPYYKKYRARKNKRLAAYEACRIAYTELKDETALVYAHLNPTDEWKKRVDLVTRRGHLKHVEIDKACFVIQKKADLVYARIAQLMAEDNLAAAEGVVSSVFSLVETMGKRGVFDHDAKVWNNFGLIEDQAVQIDVGNMKIDPARPATLVYKQEIQEIAVPFGAWIAENYPALLPRFQLELARFLED